MKIFVTGAAGFIGFHLSRLLLEKDWIVHGFDGMSDYYDVSLKRSRLKILLDYPNFSFTQSMLEDEVAINNAMDNFLPNFVVHLAAQAGVRYSLENPRAYIDSNVIGTFNVMEASRRLGVKHLLMASTSSVYGGNTDMPFSEKDKADTQLTIYAATKKANESMGHAYAHLWELPMTMFRFFTVYGPWGRPDLALFKFVDAILDNKPIDIYNHGEMYRDFTYVDDLVHGISLLINEVPDLANDKRLPLSNNDSLSSVAPFRIVNIGNSEKVRLLDFIDEIEKNLGQKAIRNYMPIQMGDVPATWANAELLKELTGYAPKTNFSYGIAQFITWYRDYYGK